MGTQRRVTMPVVLTELCHLCTPLKTLPCGHTVKVALPTAVPLLVGSMGPPGLRRAVVLEALCGTLLPAHCQGPLWLFPGQRGSPGALVEEGTLVTVLAQVAAPIGRRGETHVCARQRSLESARGSSVGRGPPAIQVGI